MHAKVMETLGSLPPTLASAIRPIVEQSSFDATLSSEQFQYLLDQTQLSDQELRLALLPLAAAYAVVPISQFYVGAIARGQSGRLYFGANMEFANTAMAHTVHAEQSAISHAWVKGETALKDMTINYSPCGHCRQFMNELTQAENLEIQLPNRQAMHLHDYLPDAFGPKDLGIEGGLLSAHNNQLVWSSDEQNICDTAEFALKAANKAHAPYSKSYSGVALKLKDGRLFDGFYAENAAFNPSLPPLQVALIHLNMAQCDPSDVVEAVLVEHAQTLICHKDSTQSLLHAYAPNAKFQHYLVNC